MKQPAALKVVCHAGTSLVAIDASSAVSASDAN